MPLHRCRPTWYRVTHWCFYCVHLCRRLRDRDRRDGLCLGLTTDSARLNVVRRRPFKPVVLFAKSKSADLFIALQRPVGNRPALGTWTAWACDGRRGTPFVTKTTAGRCVMRSINLRQYRDSREPIFALHSVATRLYVLGVIRLTAPRASWFLPRLRKPNINHSIRLAISW